MIHVIIDAEYSNQNQIGTNSNININNISNYKVLSNKIDEDIYFDTTSITYVKNTLMKSDIMKDYVDNPHEPCIHYSDADECQLTSTAIELNSDESKKQNIESVYLYATMLQGKLNNINHIPQQLVDTSQPVIPVDLIPPPRWIDLVLLLRMGISMSLFCGHMPQNKVIGIGCLCFFYYLLDTGIIRYIYRSLFLKYIRVTPVPVPVPIPSNQPNPPSTGDTNTPDSISINQPPPRPLTMHDQLSRIGGAVFHWCAKGFPIPTLDDTGPSLLMELFALVLGMIMSVFPNWNIRGMDIPW